MSKRFVHTLSRWEAEARENYLKLRGQRTPQGDATFARRKSPASLKGRTRSKGGRLPHNFLLPVGCSGALSESFFVKGESRSGSRHVTLFLDVGVRDPAAGDENVAVMVGA